jgi:hypothetical protein
VLKDNEIPYSSVSAASFIWLDLSGYLKVDTEEVEPELGWKMVNGGVWLGLGSRLSIREEWQFSAHLYNSGSGLQIRNR